RDRGARSGSLGTRTRARAARRPRRGGAARAWAGRGRSRRSDSVRSSWTSAAGGACMIAYPAHGREVRSRMATPWGRRCPRPRLRERLRPRAFPPRPHSARIRRRHLVAYVQETREARHALVRQAVVAVGHHAADRWRRGALGVGEPRADAEAQAVRALDHQRAEHAAVLALAARMPDHARLGVVVGLVLEQVVAAADPVAR